MSVIHPAQNHVMEYKEQVGLLGIQSASKKCCGSASNQLEAFSARKASIINLPRRRNKGMCGGLCTGSVM